MKPFHLGEHVLSNTEKHLIDLLSIATVVGSLVNVLPHVAAVFTIVWTAIRIWETETVRGWFGKTKNQNSE